MNPVEITITVDRMREAIKHAFDERHITISEQVQRALDAQCSPEAIRSHVEEASRGAVRDAVQYAIKRWWTTAPEGRALIEAAIVERMNEEAALYTSADERVKPKVGDATPGLVKALEELLGDREAWQIAKDTRDRAKAAIRRATGELEG